MKPLSILIFILVSASACGSHAALPGYVVASNLPATQITTSAWEEVGLIAPSYNNYNNVSKGQQFVAAFDGTLTTVESLVGVGFLQSPSVSPPLNVSIYTASAGIPITLLGTTTTPASSFSSFNPPAPTDHREIFDFSSLSIPLVAGHQYLVAFDTPFGVAGRSGSNSPYLIGYPQMFLGLTASQARNGHDWELFTGHREIAIEVRAVPEPSTILLALTAFAAFTIRCRKTISQNRS